MGAMESVAPIHRVKVWDLPTRLFHWALVVLVAFNAATGLTGGLWQMDWHMRAGECVLALVLFRVLWGFSGGTQARFASFVKGPAGILAYLKGRATPLGHNPLGALSVLAMLGVLLVLAGSGLFADDDIFTKGPLAGKVAKSTRNLLTWVHKGAGWTLFGLIGLHLSAIGFYRLKGENLVRPMITGFKEVPAAIAPDPGAEGRAWLALVLLALAGGGVAVLVSW